MNIKKCPKCLSETFEKISNFSLCHDCNYRSEKGYFFGGRIHDSKRHRAFLARSTGLPLDQNNLKSSIHSIVGICPFSTQDKRVVRAAVYYLPPLQRTIVFMRFWKELSLGEIAESLHLKKETTRTLLQNAYGRLKEMCLNNEEFSLNQISRIMQNGLSESEFERAA